ncbi:MAG: SUMF1/EgtB/PvdO family nonheme iron enzyme [Lentisphaerae bacterium]|jgi:formylglycine-generating enzyme required for sulfatase activity|nr:SUMF1/EgtB/PvdO family nonheme iron enzyme [Lentisphaerota bacterium]MBT5606803.1 SUMF1/EgtB/PvdO family nonheme iron enzyme [Lentisphaerota bacterium]MBT7061599.1 SUMF1/EgtB/PvdO family nonheme iron enzyme [Lentisphaerota bacterium]MBT7843850.1 SUMF1/EgtB/PvdO family nonheme iron enzyme [Lentisphaerota bacterium]
MRVTQSAWERVFLGLLLFTLAAGRCRTVDASPSGEPIAPAPLVLDDFTVDLVRVEPGQFRMGRRPPNKLMRRLAEVFWEATETMDEFPLRTVQISKGFFIGRYKVSCQQFCVFLNTAPHGGPFVSLGEFSRLRLNDGKYEPEDNLADHAVNCVPWEGAVAFCRWLGERVRREVRLPTEAEWEFVARGPEMRRFPWGHDSTREWTSAAPDGAPVHAYPGNSTPTGVIGMIDAIVGEWCSDFYGVRYLPDDTHDPQGPREEQLPVVSSVGSLQSFPGKAHVLRGRVPNLLVYTTTYREPGQIGLTPSLANTGFRIVVPLD